MLWRATVQREDPSKPHFAPDPQQAQVKDSIFWFNDDHGESHQLYPSTAAPGTNPWGGVVGPQTPSELVNLSVAGSITYKCAKHSDESGTINVSAACVILAGNDVDVTKADYFTAVSVPSGNCVSWGNSDENAHQPSPETGDPWFAEPIEPGGLSGPVTFKQAKGSKVLYHCAIHPNEKGTVTIT